MKLGAGMPVQSKTKQTYKDFTTKLISGVLVLQGNGEKTGGRVYSVRIMSRERNQASLCSILHRPAGRAWFGGADLDVYEFEAF